MNPHIIIRSISNRKNTIGRRYYVKEADFYLNSHVLEFDVGSSVERAYAMGKLRKSVWLDF